MVLEQIFRYEWLEKKPLYAFALGAVYALVGIFSALLIFGANPGLMAVAFTSLLLIPSLNKLLSYEENVEIRESKFSLRLLFSDHRDIFEIYVFLFLGIFFVFAFVTLLFSETTILHMFAPQLSVVGITGGALAPLTVGSLVANNMLVLLISFCLSLVYGAGSILFITWNATVWGVVFAYVIKTSSPALGVHPFTAFVLCLIPFLPHMLTEALSYFTAAISGGVVSKAVLRENLFSRKFHHVLTDALLFLVLGFILVLIGAMLEVQLYPVLAQSSGIC